MLIFHDNGKQTAEELIQIGNLSAPVLWLQYTVSGRPESRPRGLPGAVAALGMDPLATLALRKAGFGSANTLILPNSGQTAHRDALPHLKRFTIVAAGDLTPGSEVLTLLAAFAQFRQNWPQPCRLYLLGRTLNARIAKALREAVHRQNLHEDVTITGALDEARQAELLAQSDLCVYLAPQGLPPDSVWAAAAAGLPVLAPPAAPLSLALGETGLPESALPVTAEQLAATLLAFAREPARLDTLLAAQQNFSRQAAGDSPPLAVLMNALGRCGLAMPMSASQRQHYTQRLGFIVAGHFEGSYSIAAVNRMLAAALEHRLPGSVSVVPVAHHCRLTGLQGIPPAEEALQQLLFSRQRPNSAPLVVVSQHFPPWIPDLPSDLALSLFTWEETLVPPEIVHTLNTGFDGIVTVSHFAAKALIDSGVRRPVSVAGQAVDAAPFQAIAARRPGRRPAHSAACNFLHVSSCFPRKGVDILLHAWAKAFTADDDVRLTVKTFPNPHQRLSEDLARLRADHPNLAPVTLIDEDLDQEALGALYRDADCMVLPARGEGFNMVAAEALLANLPLIVTGFGGHLDFVDHANARLVDFRFAPSASHVAADGALWVEPDVEDLALALHAAFAAHQTGQNPLRQDFAASFDAGAWAEKIAQFAAELVLDPPRPLRRIAWISSWAVRCGIAEYSRELLEHRKIGPRGPELLVLCDTRTAAVASKQIAGANAVPAWRLGGGNVAAEAAPHLQSFDAQILLIQHQAGLVSWEDLIAIIQQTRASATRIIVVLHSTVALFSLYHKLRATVLFALALTDRVLVHTLQDLENLRRLGLFHNVTILPHGALGKMTASGAGAPRLPRSLVLGCYGFFLPHKGIAMLIEAFSEVLKEWPAARLRLVNAEFPSETSQAEIRSCRALARQLCVDHAIDWHTQYLDEPETQHLLSGCDLIILPYQETPESVSGAVRHAVASGCPVAVSQSPIFDELGQAVHRVNAANTAALSRDIARLIADPGYCRTVLPNAAAWLARHDWSKTSKRLFDMAEGLWQQRGAAAPRALTLTPRSELLESRIGQRTQRQLIFTGETEGYGLYGPYIDLAAGDYKITFSFDRQTELRGTARFEAISQRAGAELAVVEQTFPTSGNEMSLAFSLQDPVPEVEFRIFCHAGFQAVFNALTIALV